MELTAEQKKTKCLIEKVWSAIGMYSPWPVAVAMTESSLGVNQKSPTGAKGVFQMTSIAMKDLLLEMENKNDDVVDILCGTAFLYLLLKRWGDDRRGYGSLLWSQRPWLLCWAGYELYQTFNGGIIMESKNNYQSFKW